MNLCIDARNITDKSSGLVDYVANLVQELSLDKDIKLFVLYNKKYQDRINTLVQKNTTLIASWYSDRFLDPANLLYEQTVLPVTLNKYDINIYHCPFGFGIPAFLRAPALLTVHDVIPLTSYDELSRSQQLVYRASLHVSLKKSNHIVSISSFTLTELHRFLPFSSTIPASVIYDGFTNLRGRVEPNISQALISRLSITKPIIVYIGSATARKNLETLATAFVIAKDTYHIPHQLVLVSKFNRPETLKTKDAIDHILTKSNHTRDVIYAGYMDEAEKASILSIASLFVYPSLYEGFGLPILEAMSIDLPILCSDIPVFHEIYSDSVYYTKPNNPEAIAKAIYTTIDNKEDFIKRRTTYIHLLNRFSWKSMKEEYVKVYKNILH